LRPKCLFYILYLVFLYLSLAYLIDPIETIGHYLIASTPPILANSHKRLNGKKRIGPHDIDILSIIVGSLLGKATLEVVDPPDKVGTRISFLQESRHLTYIY
jgi:hypothetical protein